MGMTVIPSYSERPCGPQLGRSSQLSNPAGSHEALLFFPRFALQRPVSILREYEVVCCSDEMFLSLSLNNQLSSVVGNHCIMTSVQMSTLGLETEGLAGPYTGFP